MDDLMTPPPAIEPVEGGFYELVNGATIAVTKILANGVKYVVVAGTAPAVTPAKVAKPKKTSTPLGGRVAARGTKVPAASADLKFTLKEFRAQVVAAVDGPRPIVGALYRNSDHSMRDEYTLDAVRVTSVSGGAVKHAEANDYGATETYSRETKLVAFITEYAERVYEPKRLPQIVAGGVYRDHDGAIIEITRVDSKKRKYGGGSDDLAVFRVNGGDYEYREVPKFLAQAISATLDRSALSSDAFAEADYAGQVATALAEFTRAEDLLAEAAKDKHDVDAAMKAAQDRRRDALAGLKQIGNGQAMLPGVHAALVGGTGE